MENNLQTVSSDPSAATGLENKTLGVDAARYYRPEPRLGFTPYAELWNWSRRNGGNCPCTCLRASVLNLNIRFSLYTYRLLST